MPVPAAVLVDVGGLLQGCSGGDVAAAAAGGDYALCLPGGAAASEQSHGSGVICWLNVPKTRHEHRL